MATDQDRSDGRTAELAEWKHLAPEEKMLHVLRVMRHLVAPVTAGVATFCFTIWGAGTNLWTFPNLLWGIVGVAVAVSWLAWQFLWVTPEYATLYRRADEAEAERDQQAERFESQLREVENALQKGLNACIAQLLIDLNLNSPMYRVSAYSVEHDRFILLARYSANPELEQRGRNTYPLGQGVIGDAWRQGVTLRQYDVLFPSELKDEFAANDGFQPEEVDALTMLAPSICAVRVDTGPTEKLGMVVIESEVVGAFDGAFPQDLRSRPVFDAVKELIAQHEHFPRAKEWQNERSNGTVDRRLDEPAWKYPRKDDSSGG